MATATETKARYIELVARPISILPTDAARIYAFIHPSVLGLYFIARFPALVADPVSCLLIDLVPVALIQCSYVITCLPIAGSSPAPAQAAKKGKPGAQKRTVSPKTGATMSRKISTALLSIALTAMLSSPVMAAMMVLFGAPLTTHHAQTYLCACHMSLLAAFPLFYVYGVSSQIWQEIAGGMLPFDEVWGASVGCLLGAWLGAIPIPLDWDRDWQTWPITIVAGAYAGYAAGKPAGGYLLRGKRIRFDDEGSMDSSRD